MNKNTSFSEKDLKLLNEIGQLIMANLDIKKITETVYENVNKLLDANVFGIGIYHAKKQVIRFLGAKEEGKSLPNIDFHFSKDKNRLAVRCFQSRSNILINDYAKEYNRFTPEFLPPVTKVNASSIIYVPLQYKKQTLGVLTVQSFRKNAYTQYHLDLIRNVALFTAIAFSNAMAYQIAEEKSEALEQKLQEIKDMQSQLVQSERLASLGQLTAGIAHELNNPINYLYGGVIGLQHLISDILELLIMYGKLDDDKVCSEQLEEIKSFKDKIYFSETLDNIAELTRVVKEGAERSIEIVRGLQNFARPSDTEARPADLHELIDKTLLLLRGKWKNTIQIHKNYSEELQLIHCFPVPLGQVMLNILNNAIQAIPGKGNIRIKTSTSSDVVIVEVADDGEGMDKKTQEKIFEPFFTTKKTGQGTGLGLSISYGIIKKHGGHIQVASKPGHGTTFTIQLPIQKDQPLQ